MQFRFTKKIPFIKNMWYFITFSIILMSLCLVSILYNGFNYGIDFKGGISLIVRFNQPTSDGVIGDTLKEKGFVATVHRLGKAEEGRFTIKATQTEASMEETSASINAALTEKYGEGTYTIEREETVGPKVGKELRRKGELAVLFSLIAMLIYISIRFDFNYAPGAIASLAHDVIFTLGFISLFHIEFDLTILAVILTIVGYSVNDTIVIFDRIRENSKKITASTLEDVVNDSINATLTRTITTSLTVQIVLVILFFFGGGVIHNFALTFIVGLISGTYSTIFIASPVFIFMHRHWPKFAVKIGLKAER